MLASRRTTRSRWNLFGLIVVLGVIYCFSKRDFAARGYDTWPWTACLSSSPFEKSCGAPRAAVASSTQIVLRTGGTEAPQRLRSQLDTMLAGVPTQNLLIFSDLEDHIGSHRIHDVFADLLTAQERAIYPEFALYESQREYRHLGKDLRELEGGWDLSKYTNLAMMRKIWQMRQDTGSGHMASQKWFVFIDTDTFIDWDNLFGLLEHLDPAKKLYIGSPVWLPGFQFAHGGSAYVLSSGALEALNSLGSRDEDKIYHSQYGVNVTALCCGDEALARALRFKGVKLKGYWPMFNGEIPATVSFGRDLWCEPVISLHHLSGENLEKFWRWTEDWKIRTRNQRPLLFQDLFEYVAPQIPEIREDWDSIEEAMKIFPKRRAARQSFEHCKAECEADSACFQFVYDGATCALAHVVRVGRRRAPDSNGAQRYTSGWNLERIREWTERAECASAHWLRSNP